MNKLITLKKTRPYITIKTNITVNSWKITILISLAIIETRLIDHVIYQTPIL